MKSKPLPWVIVLLLISLASVGQEQKKTNVAVYQIKPANADASLAVSLTMVLSSELTPSPRLQVIEEAMLKTVMERQGLNASEACDDSSCQVEVGKLVKAQKIIAGGLAKLGNKYILSLRLVDVQSGATEFSTKDECSCSEDQLDGLIAVAAAKIRNHFGENLPIPSLPQTAAAPGALGARVPTPAQEGAQPAVTNWVPGHYTIQESHPPNTKGGPMVYVSDFNFYIDKFEVTNQDYQECVTAGACQKTEQKSDFDAPKQPVVYVDQNDARTYCQWAGKRLPKEQEWQEAARGTDGRIYTWGNDSPNCNLANYGDCKIGQTIAVGSKPAGASPYGAMDMAGNVWEYVEEKGVLRGGGWFNNAATLSVSYRFRYITSTRTHGIGFRCARDGS